MGVINVTPDSFSGDGLAGNIPGIVDLALRFQDDGADILDIGAESTRPGHAAVPEEEELARLLPALEAIASRVTLPISVDTYKPGVAGRALAAGARIINDVWGLKQGPELAMLTAQAGAGLVLMHNQRGSRYDCLMTDILSSLEQSVDTATGAGAPRDSLIIDPGIGFGKTPDQNIEVLCNLKRLKTLDLPLLVGVSRKSTLGLLLGLPPDQRVEGTAAAVALAIAGGADIVRVHDVKEMVRVCRVSDALVRGWRPEGWNG
jgi:dihydropteroate synthase